MNKKIDNDLKNTKGITLIALIITVIVLLILAGTAISIAINGGDIFGKASEARESWNIAVGREEESLNNVYSLLNNILPDGTIGTEEDETGIIMTLDGEVVTVTRENLAENLGKVATNYVGAPTALSVGTSTYYVSNQYRLFWIDFDNKYKDGAKTIYLKADYIGQTYSVQLTGSTTTSKYKTLNPSLYANGDANAPSESNSNMKGVIWLTDPVVWTSAKNGINSAITEKINYVVGAPSLEMLIDSYNLHYGLTEEVPNTTSRSYDSPGRVRLFYKYPFDSNKYGYAVAPSNDSNAVDGYYTSSMRNIIPADNTIEGMYYYYTAYNYWLSSPSAANTTDLVSVFCAYRQGNFNTQETRTGCAFCPLVSISPDVQL